MITYVIIYNIRNNKNYSIDMSIKYNNNYINSISTIISTSGAAEEKKKRRY